MERKIVFYDGDCGLCNKSVQWILSNETSHELYFSALQSDFTKDFFEKHKVPSPDLSTIIFYNGKSFYKKSNAIMRISNFLNWKFWFLKIGWILPRFIRDGMYNFIAKRRQKLANSNCFVPSLKERERFLTNPL